MSLNTDEKFVPDASGSRGEDSLFAVALLEAMACGLVPVVPAGGNVRDAVTDGESGIVLDERTADAFATAIGRLDDDIYERLSAAAPAVSDRFSAEHAAVDRATVLQTLRAS